MFDANEWADRLAGKGCPVCAAPPEGADKEWVVTLPSGRVRLMNDGDFPGYCILYHHRHVTELFELSADERRELAEDVARIAAAVSACCRPAKINYACLGNLVPHLHWHVVPRYPHDGWWGQAFSLRPADRARCQSAEEYTRLRAALVAALGSA